MDRSVAILKHALVHPSVHGLAGLLCASSSRAPAFRSGLVLFGFQWLLSGGYYGFFKEEPPGLRLVMLVSLKFLLFDQCVV
jgi:hypothetical protein